MASFLLHSLLILASTIAGSPLVKRSYPNPEPCSGLCEGYVHDPSVILRGDTYFRFTTNDGVNIATAPSMKGPWKHGGSVLPKGSIIDLPGKKDVWAPDCSIHDGEYYLYYAVSTPGSQDSEIGVATSKTMDPGSWTDHGRVGVPSSTQYNRIDPNLFQHNDSSPLYLSFGSYWNDIYQVEMDSPPLKAVGNPIHLEQNTTTRPGDQPTGPVEGSYQFQWPVDGTNYVYLFFSSGSCCNTPPDLVQPGEEYKVMVCRSESPTSDFVDKDGKSCLNDSGGSLELGSHGDVYAPGGQGVMYDANLDSVVMYYHYVKPSVGYAYNKFFFGYNKLDFSTGWPVVVS